SHATKCYVFRLFREFGKPGFRRKLLINRELWPLDEAASPRDGGSGLCGCANWEEVEPTAMHNFELGTAPGFSLLPPCRLQHLVDRRLSTGAFGLLHFGTRLLVDRFAVTRRPHATQQDLQSRDQL